VLPQGGVVRSTRGGGWPIDVMTSELPANQQMVQLGTSGPGQVLVDNRERIAEALFDQGGTARAPTVVGPERGVMDRGACAMARPGQRR